MTERKRIDELIERSTLGTSGARRLRDRTTPATAHNILDEPTTITDYASVPAALLTAAAEGDLEAIESVVELLRPLVVRYCRGRLAHAHRNLDQVDQIADAACEEIAQNLSPSETSLMGFAYSVANRHINAVDESDDAPAPPSALPLAGLAGEVASLIADLEAISREVIILRVVVGLSAIETSEVLGLRPSAVRRIQHSALGKLRKALDKQPPTLDQPGHRARPPRPRLLSRDDDRIDGDLPRLPLDPIELEAERVQRRIAPRSLSE